MWMLCTPRLCSQLYDSSQNSSSLGPWHSSPSALSRDTPKLGNSSVLPAECVRLWQPGESKQG